MLAIPLSAYREYRYNQWRIYMGALLGTSPAYSPTHNFLYNDLLGCKNRIVIERYYLSQLTQALAPKLEKLALGLSLRQGARPTQQAQRYKV